MLVRDAHSCFPAGGDAWSRAARRVIALAATQGRSLDRAALDLYDVRDLHALARRWDTPAHHAGVWWRRAHPIDRTVYEQPARRSSHIDAR